MPELASGMADGRAVLLRAFSAACKPRQRLTVSEWADANRVLTSKGAAMPGRWRTAGNPILREIMDCMSLHSPVREVTVMKSSQIGVTEGPFVGSIGYYMHHDPCAVMVLMPTLDDRDTWKVQKLNPLFSDTPAVRDLLGGIRRRDASNSKSAVDFPGGVLFLAGGNSPNSYAQKTVKVMMMDDLDRFPEEVADEGDPVELARTRFKAHIRYKFLKASTPTVEGASLIHREYMAGDQRRYHVQCPDCGEYQYLKWDNVFADEALTEAWYVCEHCGTMIPEHMKSQLLAERGHGGTAYWKPEHPEIRDHRSYIVNALSVPLGYGPSWLSLVGKFRRVHKDKKLLQVFINSDLAEVWKPQTADIQEAELMKRAAEHGFKLGEIPPGYLALTMSVDVQDEWLEYTRLAWGPADESGRRIKWAVVDHGQILGNTTLDNTWNQLEAEMARPLTNAWGKEMLPVAVGIDSRGHRTAQVKDFVMRPSHRMRVFSLQGSTTRLGRAIAMNGSDPERNTRGKVIKSGYMAWNVGTEFCKDFIYGELATDGNVALVQRSFHFAADLPEEYFYGLLSEVRDEVSKKYMRRHGARYQRNEPLDTLVYAWAVGHHRLVRIGCNRTGQKTAQYWDRLKALLEPGAKPDVLDGAADTEPENRRKRRGRGRRSGGWVKNW